MPRANPLTMVSPARARAPASRSACRRPLGEFRSLTRQHGMAAVKGLAIHRR